MKTFTKALAAFALLALTPGCATLSSPPSMGQAMSAAECLERLLRASQADDPLREVIGDIAEIADPCLALARSVGAVAWED